MEFGLGSAQFGMPYGITNHRGIVPIDEQTEILRSFFQSGLRYIDTAPGYGTAQEGLGNLLDPYKSQLRCITKGSLKASQMTIKSQLKSSLLDLKSSMVYAFLIHDYHLLGQSDMRSLSRQLRDIKESGMAVKVGASLYSIEELNTFMDFEIGDIVQVPMNILDRRFINSPQLKKAKENGIEIHARSLFLQGALLSDPPPPQVGDLSQPIIHFIEWARSRNLSTLEACWSFARAQQIADVCIIGVEGLAQFQQSLAAYLKETPEIKLDHYSPFQYDGPMLNPMNWLNSPAPKPTQAI